MDSITREADGECARIIGILRRKKAYLEETYHVGSIGIFGSCRRRRGARGKRRGHPGRVLRGAKAFTRTWCRRRPGMSPRSARGML